MKKRIFVLLIIVTILFSAFNIIGGFAADDAAAKAALSYFAEFPDNHHVISASDLLSLVSQGKQMVILDIRQPEDYAAGHVKGAINVPFGEAVAKNLEMISNDLPVYVYCYTGQTSAQTTVLLTVAGKKASSVQSGFNNGIMRVQNAASFIDNQAYPFSGEKYPVESAIQKAIDNYFSNMAQSKFPNFNVEPEELIDLVKKQDQTYTILSVRQAKDYQNGHIPGAMNIPFGKGMEQKFSSIPAGKPVIVYCYTGQTGSQTMAVLRLLGFDAYNLSGGMGREGGSGWLGAGGAVVTK